jgi:hypothetical protein
LLTVVVAAAAVVVVVLHLSIISTKTNYFENNVDLKVSEHGLQRGLLFLPENSKKTSHVLQKLFFFVEII